MRPAVTYGDAERLVVDYLEPLLDEPVSVDVPGDWLPTDGDRLQVTLDGTPRLEHPAVAHSTVRLVAWSSSTSRAKALAMRAQGLLCAHPGGGGIASTGPLTGVLPARDPDTGAQLASVTCRVTVRSTPIA